MAGRRACTSLSLLVLVSVVLLALAGPVAAAGMKATFAAGVGAADTAAVLRRLMTTTTRMRLEDGVAPELAVDLELHRRVLAGSSLRPGVFNPDRPACPQSCPARGRPYTGRGCKAIYQCPHD